MSNNRSKRRLRVQLAFIYMLMAIAVISIVAILVLVVQGYRYNQRDGKVEQGGLVQFDSRPSGATVNVDGIDLANRTASRITLTAGQHVITMSHDGYTDWKKTVTVKPGNVLWLNYSRLFPSTPTVSTATTYATDTVASALPSPDKKTMAVIATATTPEITLTSLNTDSPVTTTMTIPDAAYTVPSQAVAQQFSLVEWDKDSHLLLIKHTYGDAVEYISFDTRNATAYNITTRLGIDATQMIYSLDSSDVVYIVTQSHEIRRGDIVHTTLSGPLVDNVSSITMTEQDRVIYTTNVDDQGKRTVGYISPSATKAKTITSYTGLSDGILEASSGEYYNDRYIAILHGTVLDILKGNLPSSDAASATSLTRVARISITNGATMVGFSPDDNRMVYVVHGVSVTTYDLELGTVSQATLAAATPAQVQSQVSVTPGLQWFDGYHFMTSGGPLYVYDYDGTNGRLIENNTASNQPAIFADGDKYIYYFVSYGTTVKLQRVRVTTS